LHVYLARSDQAELLPVIERDAGAVFRTLPDYARIADDSVCSADHWQHAIAAGTCWLAARESDARALGFLGASAIDGDLYVGEVAVVHAAQLSGVGRALFAAAMAHARERQLRAVTLTTFRDVPWNAPTYTRMGFETIDDAVLPAYLRAIREREAEAGLPWNQRCAMELLMG